MSWDGVYVFGWLRFCSSGGVLIHLYFMDRWHANRWCPVAHDKAAYAPLSVIFESYLCAALQKIFLYGFKKYQMAVKCRHKQKNMIKNVIFDLGGVVLGRDFEKYGDSVRPFDFMHGGDKPFPWFWKDFDLGVISQRGVAEAISAEEGVPVGEADALITRIGEMFNEFPQTVALIGQLKERGYKLYVLSNMPHEFWEMMKDMEVFGYFDGVVISSREKMAKPDPAFFRLLLDRYGLEPSETLFVDDKVSNTAPAAELGMAVCTFDPATGPDDVRRLLGIE